VDTAKVDRGIVEFYSSSMPVEMREAFYHFETEDIDVESAVSAFAAAGVSVVLCISG
jgi:hypothetical protein